MTPALYLRRSNDPDQYAQEDSIARNLGVRNGWPAPKIYMDREDANRAERSRLIKEIKEGQWPVLIVYSIQHLAVTRDELAETLKILKDGNCRLVCASEEIDLRGDDAPSRAQQRFSQALIDFPYIAPPRPHKGRARNEISEEQQALVEKHYAEHGVSKYRELGRLVGVSSPGQVQRWLKDVEKAKMQRAAEESENCATTSNEP